MAVAPIVMAVVVGVCIGLLRGGRFSAIARTRIRHPEFLAVAIVCSVAVDSTDVGQPGAIALVGLIGGVAFAAVNLHLTGMAVIGVGLIANLVPVALNGAMPVRPEALVEAEMVAPADLDRVSLTGARELADDSTRLQVLGDTIPVRFTGQVVSIGDLIAIVGLTDVVANLMLRRRRRRVPHSALPSLAALGWNERAETEGGLVDLELPVDFHPGGREIPSEPELVGAGVGQSASSSTASPVHD